MARTILNKSPLPKTFWMDVINTTYYIMNRALIRPILNKMPYELYFGRKPNISHLHIFGCKCYVHNNGKDNLDKFHPKSNEEWFLGYSSSSKAFHVYNQRTLKIEEFIHVAFDEFSSSVVKSNEEDKKDWINSPSSTPSEDVLKQ